MVAPAGKSRSQGDFDVLPRYLICLPALVAALLLVPSPAAAYYHVYYGYPYYTSGYGSYLDGVASVTDATGSYHQQIQQARITREVSRQMAIDTQRKQIEFAMWYETVRPTAPKMRKAEQATDLDWARNHAQKTEIWSGRTLNVLLASVLNSSSPTQGRNIPLSDTALRGLNLTDGATSGSLSLAKNEGKITWTEALEDEDFDSIRDHFSRDFETATRQAFTSQRPSRALMNSLRADLKTMEEMIAGRVGSLSPTDFIRARRLLGQLGANLKGLSNTQQSGTRHADWRRNVRTVADLVAYCQQNGLQFGPAVDGDEASYTAAYNALRSYERSLVVAR
jgi:hypothetical protein